MLGRNTQGVTLIRIGEDESLVGRIQENLDRLRDLDRHVAQTRQGIADLASKRAELERSRDHFYRSGYDNPIGGFSNGEAIGEVIGDILAGAIKNGQLAWLPPATALRTRWEKS